MDTGVIIAIVIGALVLLALLFVLGRRAREQAARARQERELAEERHEHARQVDPDVDDRETSERRS